MVNRKYLTRINNYQPVSGSHSYPTDSDFQGDWFLGTTGNYGLHLRGLACESVNTYFTVKVTFSDKEGNSVGPFYSSQALTTLNPATGSILQYNPESLTFYASTGVNPPSQSLQISTYCGESLNWEATTNVAWLNIPSSSGTIPEWDSSNIEVTADVTGLAQGIYNAEVTVTSASAVNSLITIPVALNINY